MHLRRRLEVGRQIDHENTKLLEGRQRTRNSVQGLWNGFDVAFVELVIVLLLCDSRTGCGYGLHGCCGGEGGVDAGKDGWRNTAGHRLPFQGT